MNQFVSKALLVSATLGLSSAAWAQTTIYITGSTAFRQQVYNALTSTSVKINGNNQVDPAGVATTFFIHDGSYHDSSATFNGAKNQFLVQGKTVATGTNIITVSCAFSGSVEGIVAVLEKAQPANAVLNNYLTAYNGTATVAPSTVVADLAFSDVYQSTTTYSKKAGYTDLSVNNEFTDASGTGVGIIPFGWGATSSLKSTLGGNTNITHQVAQTMLGVGYTELKSFTGNTADTSKVYLTGRYTLSGTRLTTQADTGKGANAASTLYTVTGNGGSVAYAPSSASTAWATNTIGTADPNNGGGYNSGGSVVGLIASASALPFVGYAGWPDLAGKSLIPLSYDGVPLTQGNIQNGHYSMWSVEHLYSNPVTIPDTTDTTNLKVLAFLGTGLDSNPCDANYNIDPFLSNGFLAFLNAEIGNNPNVVQIGSMNATRTTDGSVITAQ